MTIDTIAIQCFIAAAETGSFTKAAEVVNRTQSAVSQQIAKLEEMVGKTLFIRGKNLTLTEDGTVFLGYARQILTLHRETLDHFKEPELEGEVHFGIPEDFASVFLYDVLKEFVQFHPRISLHIECDLTMNLIEKFKKKQLDLAILKMTKPREIEHGSNLSSQKLCWAGEKRLLKKDASIPLILSPEPCVYRESAINALQKKKKKWHIALSSHSYAGKIAAIRAGLGITALPQNMIPRDITIIKSEQLPTLKDSQICLVKQNDKSAAINFFEDFVVKHLR